MRNFSHPHLGAELRAKPCDHHADLLHKGCGLCNNANQLCKKWPIPTAQLQPAECGGNALAGASGLGKEKRRIGSLSAYTSVIPVHRLDNAINYTLDKNKTSRSQMQTPCAELWISALNRDKTEQDLLESALGCTCETAFEDMCRVKEMWRQNRGFHTVRNRRR